MDTLDLRALQNGDEVLYQDPKQGARVLTLRTINVLPGGVVVIETLSGERVEAFAGELS